MNREFEHIRNQTIGTVEYVSPREIKVLLETNAPQNTAINTGIPQLFPKVNGFILIPNESGALVGIISWIGIEYSPYPKRKGYKDFDLIDLPFPLRKLSVSPLGILKENNDNFEIERGIYSYPSVGDIVVVPNQKQLRAIVQNKDNNAKVKIGVSPMAANASVFINPDRVFGRHIAILGNTGSGKSCSVAGLIRWSIEGAKRELPANKKLNARFIILDPNGEYSKSFETLGSVRKYQVVMNDSCEEEPKPEQLKVPTWMWNSYEWSSIVQATGKTQRPILRRALREVKSGREEGDDSTLKLRRYYSSCLIEIRNDLLTGASAFKGKPGKNEFGKKIHSMAKDAAEDQALTKDQSIKDALKLLADQLKGIADTKYKTFNSGGNTVEYYEDFEKANVEGTLKAISEFLAIVGGFEIYKGPDEDTPVFFNNCDFLDHLDRIVQENNSQQYMDFFLMRIKSILSDARIASVIETKTKEEITLESWLNRYIGNNEDDSSINIIDLSLLPSEILFVIVSVLSRVIFEAHQRFKRKTGQILPTTLVVEEAHNFIKRYEGDYDEITANRLCSQSFEKIAKEGRKFGLGLVISSQRPSELSQTVLSQCNTFLLHRLVNDKDQEMVKKLVPDNLGSILNELPILPTRKAILLGWAAPIPVIVEMNNLEESNRPQSKDPEYWDVWTNKQERNIDWKAISDEWQNEDNI
ncbi:MAG TPA: ATP-binding protein [Smithella sp.]|nr:ATP-binding protein [Smithella sp.]